MENEGLSRWVFSGFRTETAHCLYRENKASSIKQKGTLILVWLKPRKRKKSGAVCLIRWAWTELPPGLIWEYLGCDGTAGSRATDTLLLHVKRELLFVVLQDAWVGTNNMVTWHAHWMDSMYTVSLLLEIWREKLFYLLLNVPSLWI